MRASTLFTMLLAGAIPLGATYAQEAPVIVPSTPYSLSEQQRAMPPDVASGAWMDNWHGDPRQIFGSNSYLADGIAALQADDYAKAEEVFAKSLFYNKNDVITRFYMGVTQVKLEKWEEARRYLRTPARDLRKAPVPKGYLGVAYARLGDRRAALAQRASLLGMAESCKGMCENAASIATGIQMIDEALALAPSGRSGE